MKIFLCLLFMVFSVSLSAQDQTEKEPQVNVFNSALQQGDLLNFGNKAVRFKEVISDSRCPKNVTCVWPGEATVKVEVFENGNLLEEKIISVNESNISLNFSAENILYKITGITLSPYPTISSKNEKPDYVLQMRISEKL